MSASFVEELDELRLQVEVMALRVDDVLDKTVDLLHTGDRSIAAELVAGDDEIDSMEVSLTERCYDLLMRQSLMASDLRLVVSVVRVLGSLERIGDLCLRVAHQVDDIPLLAKHPAVDRVLKELGGDVRGRYSLVHRAWASSSIDGLDQVAPNQMLDEYGQLLVSRILELEGRDALRVGMAAFVIGRSFDRIGDHTHVIATRLRYLVTGDSQYLADEVAE